MPEADSRWDVLPLPEVFEFREGPGIMARDFRSDGVPLIRLAGLRHQGSLLTGCNHLDPDMVASRWGHFRLRVGDVLLSTSASLGEVAVVDPPAAGSIPYTGIISFRPRDDRVRADFVRHALSAPSFARQIEAMGAGSVLRHFGPMHLRQMTVDIPPQSVQRAIAEVLGALDDKIEANRRASVLSQGLIQATWRDAASKATTWMELSDIADLDKGLSYKGSGLGSGVPLVNLANFGTDGVFHSKGLKRYSGKVRERHWVSRGDLVIANTDLTQRREILGQPAIVDADTDRVLFTHHVYAVRLRGAGDHRLWLYAAFRDQDFRDRAMTFATGTTVAALPRDAALTYEVPWPDETVRSRWQVKARAIIDRAESAEREHHVLAALRDTLLPKLLSGDLRVRDAERLVEAAV